MKEKLLGSDDELVAVALRLLWDLDMFLADAATDRVGHIAAAQRSTLISAISGMREALAGARVAAASQPDLRWLRRMR